MWAVDLAWMEQWVRRDEACPSLWHHVKSETQQSPAGCSEDDPASDAVTALQLEWYHTSTYDDWPSTIDFGSGLDDDVRRMMGGDEAVFEWARRQSAKALHVGTYESAIHNMLRRISDQGDRGKRFLLVLRSSEAPDGDVA